ncbi:bacterioferritin [Pikeienuella piscinae]|uniref:Bacterioferritin n=1 Tax=Pikeienuella piscinae TaxID=2748098 RepID=A0A7L5BZX6_9RHOB|nr:bacterioferritin [Pikeienuella piscinae]QIE56673.1 bacterioferritin [Pikeienuella piscinae]
MSNAKTLENLNKALQMEMTASHQYQLHAHVLDDWGLDKLAAQMREEQAEEIVHSDRFMERVLFLGGDPVIAFANTPKRAGSLVEMFQSDLADEKEAVAFYSQSAKDADAENDLGSRKLFEEIALDEEGHKAWLEMQLGLIERIGESAYSAKQVTFGSAAGDSDA